jgi:hypothetical protein
VVIDCLSFQRLDLCFQLFLLHFVVILLSVRPFLDPLRFFLVKSEFLLFQVVVFVNLSVFHLEF